MHVGKKIKVFFKNGITCEGIISKWENNEAILSATDSRDVLWITDIKEDVMFVRFYLDDPQVEAEPPPPKEGLPPIVEPEIPQVQLEKPGHDQQPRLKRLADLRQEQSKILKENVANRVKSLVPTNIQRPTYAQPSFAKRLPKKHPTS